MAMVAGGSMSTYELLQFLKTEDVGFLGVRPAQKSGEVDQRGCEHAVLILEVAEINVCVSFAELLAGLVYEEGNMTEARRCPVEGVIQGDMHGCRGHPFLYKLTSAVCSPGLYTHGSPDHMGDLHAMIVHHICQMVGRVSVGFEKDRVIVDSLNEIQLVVRAVLSGLAIDQVIEHGIALDLQAHDMRFALCDSILGFFGGDVCTLSVVTRS
jgi:hypothetical protein